MRRRRDQLDPCATIDRKERTPLPAYYSSHPQVLFTADLSVFTGTPPLSLVLVSLLTKREAFGI